jgi:CBS domain-containing protein
MHRLRSVIQAQTLVTATPETSVFDVVSRMKDKGVGAVPILDGERLVGIFSERDLLTRVVVPELDPRKTLVSRVMTGNVVTASLEEHVDYCIDKMKQAGCRHLPIVVNGRPIAMISMRDLLRDELKEQHEEIRNLRAYLHQAPL